MPMALYILKRLGLLALTLLLVSAAAFIAFSIIPGDPTDAVLGTEATPEQVAALRAQLGLDEPLLSRYFRFLGGLVRGDLGISYNFSVPVAQLLAARVGVTLTLAALAMALIAVLSFPLGLLSARLASTWAGRALTAAGQVVMSVPAFLTGIALTYGCGLCLHLFVPGAFVPAGEDFGAYIRYLLFPALAVALPKAAMTGKLLRAGVLAEQREGYVRTARSRGCSESRILWRHVLRNAMIGVVSFLASTMGDIVAGSIVVEQVFSVPGVGQMLVASIGNRDYPVVQAIVVLAAAVVVICNFTADILYRAIDPRLRQEAAK